MIATVKKFFEINFFFSSILVPIIALTLYCVSFAYFSSLFLMEGVNYFFTSRLSKYALLLLAALSLIFVALLLSKKAGNFSFKYLREKFYPGDLLLLLLPSTPAVQYVLKNQGVLSIKESMYVLAFILFISAVYIFALPAFLRTFFPIQTLMIIGLAFVFTIISMASISNYFAWFEKGALRTQLLFFGGAFLVVWLLYNLNLRNLLYFLLALNLVVNSSIQLVSEDNRTEDPSLSMEKNKLLLLTNERAPVVTPNIYLLIYDAYVSNETMLAHGIDNSAQESYLTEQGFKLYPHTYSIGATTVATLSKVLNASPAYYGEQRRAVSGDGVTQNILRSIGYKTYGIFASDYMFRGVGEHYDFSVPKSTVPPYIRLLKAILVGEFRFDLDEMAFEGQAREQFIKTKQQIFKNISGNRVFVFMYTNVPGHSQTSGTCRLNETELYQERLTIANVEMQQDIETIIQNDPNAVVIIAGDHGPYLTKNCIVTSGTYDISEISRLDIQDRYGMFLAIRWPTDDFAKYDDITVLQDVFPAVFAYLYNDTAILQSKVDPMIPAPINAISGASVNKGIISGGINDGEPLFLSGK